MLKKVLYVTASFVLGFMLITFSIYNTFVSVYKDNVADMISAGDYVEAERCYAYVLDKNPNNKIIIDDKNNSAYIEIYPSVNERTHTVNTEKGDVSYQTLETGLSFTFFTINEGFQLFDNEGVKGGVEFVYDNDERLFFPFYVNEVNNYYSDVALYSFLPFNITNNEYNLALANDKDNITGDSVIRKVEIKDGTGAVKLTYDNTDSKLSFNTSIYNDFNETLTQYSAALKDAASKNETKVDENLTKPIVEKFNNIVEDNENYVDMQSQDGIFKSSKFLFPVIITAVIFLALDVAIAWLLFRKKKVSKASAEEKVLQAEVNKDVIDVEATEKVEETEVSSTETEE